MNEFIHDKYTLKALEEVRLGRSFFITGKAGTGKTTLLKKIVQECRARGKNIVVTAPTGIAAKNAEGQTLHSLFGLKTIMFIPGKIRTYFVKKRVNEPLIRKLDILIIDEISMVRCDLLDMVDHSLRRIKGNKEPFGGVQVILFGDMFQLPPVVTNGDKLKLLEHYETPYFFSSDVIKRLPFPVLELQEVHRQKGDDTFVEILNHIREGLYLDEDMALLNTRLRKGYAPSEKESAIYFRTANWKVRSYNNIKLEQLTGDVVEKTAEIEGYFPKEQYPTEYNLKLKVGAKVMLLRNDNDGQRYVNGTQGIIESFYEDEVRVMTSEGHLVSVTPSAWELYEYVYDKDEDIIKPVVVATFTQYPLKLAWAITIHKSQGMTFDKSIVDARNSFATGQVYVALSRCRSLKGLTLTSRIGKTDLLVDGWVIEYMNSVKKINPDEDEETVLDKEKEIFFFADEGKTITGISSDVYGEIEIPNDVVKIAKEAFLDNTNISSAKCPDTLRTIEDKAFKGCLNLSSVTLNEGLSKIGFDAFLNTNIAEIHIPSTVRWISFTPFDCTVKVDSRNNYYADKDGKLYNKDYTSLELCPRKTKDATIKLPRTVKIIQLFSFEKNKAEEVIIPEGIEELKDYIFSGCENLRTITIYGNQPEKIKIGEKTFNSFEVEKCVLRVPFKSLPAYKADERFKGFKCITAIEGSRCLLYDEKGKSVVGCDSEGCEKYQKG